MKTIKLLPPEVISRIAAGEVIERPAYAVKELIDNSLDAGADNLTIYLENNGLKKIIVHDNGHGMSKDDLLESFKIHTTSKVHEVDDLSNINSLGFRGEALASMAAMSELVIQSRDESSLVGTEVKLKNGVVNSINPLGMPVGTTVIINNLFQTIPARKKFLKSARTELGHIIDIVISAAVGNPKIGFSLYHNQRKILILNKSKERLERISLLFPVSKMSNMIQVSHKDQFIEIRGLISPPTESLSTSNKEIIYINERQITDTQLQKTIKLAYGSLLPFHRYPYFIIFIKLPFEFVDVNIHPRKEQVGIANKENLIEELTQVVQQALQKYTITSDVHLLFSPKDKTTNSVMGLLLQENVDTWMVRDSEQNALKGDPLQIDKTFILLPVKKGFYLVDQHAAHERILYEQFSKAFLLEQSKVEQFILSAPVELDLPFVEMQKLTDSRDFLKRFGFTFSTNKTRLFLTAVPLIFRDRNYVDLILELLTRTDDVLVAKEKSFRTDIQTHKTLAYLSCRQAIMAGDMLSNSEMKRLLEQLNKTSNNTTCPHGRPTRVYVSQMDLYRVFKRK